MRRAEQASDLVEMLSRQLLVEEIGSRGFKRLLNSRVLIIGCGATGSLVAELLTRAGVGYLRIIDRDFVDLSNLNRSHLFLFEDAKKRRPKSKTCSDRLRSINPYARIEPVVASFDSDRAIELARGFDLLVDATDNFQTRYLINEVSITLGTPWVHIGVERWHGQVALFIPNETACLKCVVPAFNEEAGDACETRGVVNTAVGVLASIAANEALKYLLGLGRGGTLYVYDALSGTLDSLGLRRDPSCSVCGRREFEFLRRRAPVARRVCGSNSVEVLPPKPVTVLIPRGAARLLMDCGLTPHSVSEDTITIRAGELVLTLFTDGRCIVDGTIEIEEARRRYAELMRKLEACGLVREDG